MLQIPSKIQYIINTLASAGFEAYIVGGCVRDMLLGANPHDYDITTSANPEQVIPLFEKTIPTGIKHGTVTVVIDGDPVEITTFRSDGNYSDCRRPDKVVFVKNLKDDLARRDFTVNALAFNNESGLHDYFQGEDDLNNRILRAVGEPERRFHEDALRILRLFRFSSVLGFEIEQSTLEAAISSAPLLQNISRERIMTELVKTVCGINPSALKPLTECGGLNFLGINKSPDYSKILKLNYEKELAVFTFLYLSECDIEKTLGILKSSNNLKNSCRYMSMLLKEKFPSNKPDLKEMLNLTSVKSVKSYLDFESVVFNRDTKNLFLMLEQIISFNEPYKISDLNIGGRELTKAGITGQKIKTTLEKLRLLVVANPHLNSKEILLEKMREINS